MLYRGAFQPQCQNVHDVCDVIKQQRPEEVFFNRSAGKSWL